MRVAIAVFRVTLFDMTLDNACANRKKQCRPNENKPYSNATHRAKDKMILQMVTPQAASSQRTHVSRTQGRARTHPVTRRVTTPRTCREVRNFMEKSKSCRPGATKRLVAQRDEPACTRASSAALVPLKRVLSLNSRTRITSCGLHS